MSAPLLALVLAGGGARGAYEAGVIHYIRTQLPPAIAKKRFQIYCGSSVGGINTAFSASLADYPKLQGEELRHVWENLRQEDIYRRDLLAFGKFLAYSVASAMWNLVRKQTPKTAVMGPHFNGFFDTTPFKFFLKRIIPWQHLHRCVRDGIVGGVSLTATNMHDGRMELFIDHHESVVYSGNYVAHMGPLHWRHAMASAALPILFSPVKVGNTYYADGGLRANTPMSPAIHLGSDRLLVIGMHSASELATSAVDPKPNSRPPSMGEVAGTLLQTMFVDRLDYDLKQLNRINQIVDWGKAMYGDNFVEKLNKAPLRAELKGDIATRGVKQIEVFTIFPSQHIPDLFEKSMRESKSYGHHYSTFEKILMRLLDIDPYRSSEFLSYMLFVHDYLKVLTKLGFEDADAQRHQLTEFLSV